MIAASRNVTETDELPVMVDTVLPLEAAMVSRWIKELDSDDFKVREQASHALPQRGEVVLGSLLQAKKGKLSLEQRKRIDELLDKLGWSILGPEQLRPCGRWRFWSTSARRLGSSSRRRPAVPTVPG